MEEIVLVNKPIGFSAFDVIRMIKIQNAEIFNDKDKVKIGHAGTLDPLATGLMIVLVGDATKCFNEFQQYDKEYVFTVAFGFATDTYDIMGKVVKRKLGYEECIARCCRKCYIRVFRRN